MTKQEALNILSQLNEEQLNKLVTISESILTPLDTSLVKVDFASMIDEVFKQNGLADTYFPEWTDRSKGDFGRFLVELFALFSDKDFFYLNHFSREAHATTCELYHNLLHKAESNGVNIEMNNPAEGIVTAEFETGATVTYPKGSIILTIQDSDILYTNKNEFTLLDTETVKDIEFIQGELKTLSGNFNGRSIKLADKNIGYRTIKLTVEGDVYTEVDSFAEYNQTSKVFKVFYNEYGQAEIIFSNFELGYTPPVNSFWETEYFVTEGRLGNITPNTINQVKECPNRQILNFTHGDFTGGTNLLSFDELKFQVVNRQFTQDRVVTRYDMNITLKQLDFVHQVKTKSFSNMLFVYVVPKVGTLSTAQINEILSLLDSKLLFGYSTSVNYPDVATITLDISLSIFNTVDATQVLQKANDVVLEYLDPHKNGKIGNGVRLSELFSLLTGKVLGVQNVIINTIYNNANPTTEIKDILVSDTTVIDIDNSTITINVI